MLIHGIYIETIPLRNVNTKNLISNLYATPFRLNFCPQCASSTHEYTHAIVISETQCTLLHGTFCSQCNAFYCEHSKIIHVLDKYLKNQIYNFNYDYDIVPDIYTPTPLKSNFVYCEMFLLKKHDLRKYSIVTSKNLENLKTYQLHYSNPIALTLLTAMILRKPQVTIDNTEYVIERIKFPHESNLHFLNPQNNVKIIKKRNGGYYQPDTNIISIDGLVFSGKSKRLEVLKMSYDVKYQIYYVDQQIFDSFLNQYGPPIVNYISSYNDYGVIPLKNRSLLNMLGYNVGQNDNHSDTWRQQRLIDIVEMGFMDIHSIVALLKRLISLNSKKENYHIAVEKWKMDLQFISNYRIDPSRFVFVSNIRNLKI